MAQRRFTLSGVRRESGVVANGDSVRLYLPDTDTLAHVSATDGGSALASSMVGLDSKGGATFYGPTDLSDELDLEFTAEVSFGRQRIYADPDPRLDALEALEIVDFDARLDIVVDEGPLWLDDPRIGAELDGVTDDGAAYDVAKAMVKVAHASGAIGGAIGIPARRCLLTNRQLKVPEDTVLRGVNRGSSKILAGPSFPNSTAVVRLGEDLGANAHGCRIEHLVLDANNVAGSVGVYSNEAQEMSGVYWSVVVRFTDVGIHLDTGCENCGTRSVEVYPSDGAAAGIRMEGVVGAAFIERTSVVEVSGSGEADVGLDVIGSTCSVRSFHAERTTTGISFADGSNGTIDGVVGHPSITNLFHNDADTYLFTLLDLKPNGATNAVVDDYNGGTLANAELDVNGAVHYIPRKIYFGPDIAARPLGRELFIDGRLELPELADAANSPANTAIIGVRDNGSGKTQVYARFPSGAVQIIATEP